MADILQSDEWQKATDYKITDDDIARQKALLGYNEASRTREYIQTATEDNIRNWAHGIGDDNPLFCDPAYARASRWGGVIAPPMMVSVVNSPMKGQRTPEDIRTLKKSLFRGIHVFVSGSRWNWYRPLRPGDTIYSFSGDESSDVKASEFAGRSVINVRRIVKINQRSEVVAVNRVLTVLTERGTAAKKGKYAAIEPARYEDEDIERLDAVYAAEHVQGATTRDWETVQPGQSLGVMAKGPLTVTDVICFHAGGYGFVPYAPSVGRIAYKNRMRIPPFYIKNEHGVPDVAQRLHWDPVWAQAIGNPMAYDYGFMRENYLAQYLTDWAGDDGVLVSLHDEIRKFNYMGDIQTITGEVVAKRQENGLNLVDVAVRFTNQRGEETVKATATLALPSGDHPVRYPETPADLADDAVRMMATHWRLANV